MKIIVTDEILHTIYDRQLHDIVSEATMDKVRDATEGEWQWHLEVDGTIILHVEDY